MQVLGGRQRLWILVLLAVTLAFWAIHDRIRSVTGPFIFGDESAYFNFGRILFSDHKFELTQYNILYPLLVAPWFFASNAEISYFGVLTMNQALVALSVVPWFLICQLFFGRPFFSFFLSVGIMLMPWSAYAGVILAEPLFYFLYSWAWYFFFKVFFVNEPSKRDLVFAGTLTALAMMTKQSAMMAAAGVALGILILYWQRHRNLLSLRTFFPVIAFCLPVAVIYGVYLVAFKVNSGVAAVGYAGHFDGLFANLGLVFGRSDVYECFMHQLGYFFVASLFLTVPSFVFATRKDFPAHQRIMAILPFVIAGFISVLAAIFLTSFDVSIKTINETQLAQGRYLVVCVPAQILVGIWTLTRLQFNKSTARIFFAVLLVQIVIAGIFSPVRSFWSMGIIAAQDPFYFNQLLGVVGLPSREEAIELGTKFGFRVALHLAIGFLLWIFVFKKISKRLAIFFLSGFLIWTGAAHFQRFMMLVGWTEGENMVYRKLISDKIPLDQVARNNAPMLDVMKMHFWYGYEAGTSWMKKNETYRPEAPYVLQRLNDGSVPEGFELYYHQHFVSILKKLE